MLILKRVVSPLINNNNYFLLFCMVIQRNARLMQLDILIFFSWVKNICNTLLSQFLTLLRVRKVDFSEVYTFVNNKTTSSQSHAGFIHLRLRIDRIAMLSIIYTYIY